MDGCLTIFEELNIFKTKGETQNDTYLFSITFFKNYVYTGAGDRFRVDPILRLHAKQGLEPIAFHNTIKTIFLVGFRFGSRVRDEPTGATNKKVDLAHQNGAKSIN